MSTSAFLFIWIRSSVLSLEETSFKTELASELTVFVRTTGVTVSAFWRCLSSSSWTYLPLAKALSLEKMRPTSMSPLSSAALVSGPPASSALKALKWMP